MKGRMKGGTKTAVVASVLIGLLALAVAGAVYAWVRIGAVEIGLPGILAMTAGIVFSLALGMGLMWLVFRSERDRKDDC